PLDLIDGIDLESLVAKRTSGLMQPQLRPQIEKSTRKQFPDGIPEFGTDALRFTFTALASTGRDIRFDLNRIEGYRNFCNKLWNAARFVMMNLDGQEIASAPGSTLADRWILSRLSRTLETVEQQFAAYRFDLVARALYEFTWNEYCDWYLELTKPVLQENGAEPSVQAATRRTLITVLEALLRALHPVMPFITEEIWQKAASLAGACGDSIMLQHWPDPSFFPLDDQAEEEIAWLQGFILGIRQIRGEMNISPGKRLPVLLQDAAEADRARLSSHEQSLRELARLESIELLPADAQPPASATALLGGMKLLVPLAGLIDVAAERERLEKNRQKLAADLERVRKKLGNESFVSNAPEEVVQKERERATVLERDIEKLEEQVRRLAGGGQTA
ncbi:MAG: class I tRNA ligase family protein, partial [Chromatiales bacterium]|nr:class I tRNA ligase family protein [Chromatiales bacterium]